MSLGKKITVFVAMDAFDTCLGCRSLSMAVRAERVESVQWLSTGKLT